MPTTEGDAQQASSYTLGERRVRLSFNPSNNPDVEDIKRQTADLIDLVERFRDKDARLVSLAQTSFEEACMWAVKAATT